MEQQQSEPIVKRWVGYVCPECYMIFRMEVGNGGRRAQCPGCQALVVLGGKVPVGPAPEEARSGDEEPEVVAAGPAEPVPARQESEVEPESVASLPGESRPGGAQAVGGEGGPEESRGMPARDESETREREDAARGAKRRKKVRKRKGKPREPAWEKQVRKKKMKRMGWVTPVAAILALMAVGAGVAYWARSIVGWGGDEPVVVRGGLEVVDEGIPETGVDTDVGVEDLAVVVEAFLGAKTVNELLETVRDRERLEPSIRRYYAEGYAPVPVRQIAPDGQLQTTGGLFSVLVELPDFSRKPIALAREGDGFLVDWESWVGYSEMRWDEFMRRRPTEPALFRVKTQQLDYYNFDFSDDKNWQSFRLESPDGEHTLYAYVPRYSAMVQELKPLNPKVVTSTHTLRLRYAEGASRPDQVLVEEVIASGWVVEETSDGKF